MQVQFQKSLRNDGQTIWHFDPSHTLVEFSVKQLFLFAVKGRVSALEGRIALDNDDMARSSVKAMLKADSIDTGNAQRDKHLRAPAFLDAASHPQIRFESFKVGPGRDRDVFRVTGSLTIKGTTREVTLDATEVDRSRSPRGEEVIYYTATTELDRHAFGINYGRGVIGRTLKVTINVQATRPIQAGV
jgi:polyisoprenoid-binding protein YceI